MNVGSVVDITLLIGFQKVEHSFGRAIVEESRVATILFSFSFRDHFCVCVGWCDGASRLRRICHGDKPAGAFWISACILCRGVSLFLSSLDHGGIATAR